MLLDFCVALILFGEFRSHGYKFVLINSGLVRLRCSEVSIVCQVHVTQLVATRVTLSTTDLPAGVGVQHLWVCNSSGGSCHVSIMSLHTNEPCVVELFDISDVVVTACETVPGCSAPSSDKFAFADDTVWLAAEDER